MTDFKIIKSEIFKDFNYQHFIRLSDLIHFHHILLLAKARCYATGYAGLYRRLHRRRGPTPRTVAPRWAFPSGTYI